MSPTSISLLLVLVGTSFLLQYGPVLRHVAAEEFKFKRASHRAWQQKKSNELEELLSSDAAAEEKRNSLSQRELRKKNLFDSRSRSRKSPEEGRSKHKKNNRSSGKQGIAGGGKKRGGKKRGKQGIAKITSRSTKGSKKGSKIPRHTPCPSAATSMLPNTSMAMANPAIESAIKDIESAVKDIELAINDPKSCSKREEQICCRDMCAGDYMTHYCNNEEGCWLGECRQTSDHTGFLTTCSGICPEFRCHCEQPSYFHYCRPDKDHICSSRTKLRCCSAQCFGRPPFIEPSEWINAAEYCRLLSCDDVGCPPCP